MHLRRVVSVAVLLCMLPQLAIADQLVLRDGQRVNGTIANREQVAEDPLRQDSIGILVGGPGELPELHRFQLHDIEYVILEDPSGKRVLDIVGLEQRIVTSTLARRDNMKLQARRRRDTGAGLFAVGAIVVTVGALVKFGGEKLEVTESSLDYDEKSYNALNYVLIGGGALLTVIGITMMVSAPHSSAGSAMSSRNDRAGGYLALSLRF